MHKALLSLLLGSSVLSTQAQVRPDSTSYFDASFDGVIAQFVDGGSWKTTVTLVNLDTMTTTYTLSFYGDDGSPMNVATSAGSGTEVSGNLPIGGSVVIETSGSASALLQGWALLHSSGITGGNAIFRQQVAGLPDFEASLPITTYVNSHRYAMPFDQTVSTTGVALVNPLTYTSIPVLITFRDEQGNQILQDSLTLAALQHLAFSLSDRYPQLAGKRGVAEFETSGLSMGVLGLRFAGGSFTAVLPMTSISWM